MRRTRAAQGFTIVELMLAALVGSLLCGVVFQLLFAETRQGGSLAESFQLKQWQRRTLELVKGDLARASSWRVDPDASDPWPCALAGRQPKLAITPPDGSDPVLYSLGPAPSLIWRGAVLMRCGPAFDLQGGIRSGSRYQNRVVLDGVDRFELIQPPGLPVLQLELEQRTRRGGRVRSHGVGQGSVIGSGSGAIRKNTANATSDKASSR